MSTPLDLTRTRRVHLVGVGGAGMSGIARILLQRGHRVSGSDLKDGRLLDELRSMGGVIHIGHEADHLGDAEAVVRSTAVPDSNVELLEAERRRLPVLQRAQMLAALMQGHRTILVSGTHGKTTTTSMVTVALQATGLDPSFAIGGQLNEVGTNAHAGADRVFVAEADESDRSFLAYSPDLAIVTNVELDHPDEYDSDDDVAAAFTDFLARRGPDGIACVCLDDPGAAALLDHIDGPVVTYGESPEADVRLVVGEDVPPRVRLDDDLVPLELTVPGRHNLLNATAALAACRWAGADLDVAATGLRSFAGAQRRFQRLGTAARVDVVDDYAHHPTELRTTLAAARTLGYERIVVVVQPHRYSRTARFGEELGRAAAAAEIVVVTDVYGAGEEPVPGVSGRLVADGAEGAGAVVIYEPHLADVVDRVVDVAREGDLVLVTGAGDVTQAGPQILERLRGRRVDGDPGP